MTSDQSSRTVEFTSDFGIDPVIFPFLTGDATAGVRRRSGLPRTLELLQSHSFTSERLSVDDFLRRDVWATRRVALPQIDLGYLVTAWRGP